MCLLQFPHRADAGGAGGAAPRGPGQGGAAGAGGLRAHADRRGAVGAAPSRDHAHTPQPGQHGHGQLVTL